MSLERTHPTTPAEPPIEMSTRTTIGRDRHEAFVVLSGDRNPIHVDRAHARARGFPDVVIHGAHFGALVSHWVGETFPWPRTLIHSIDLRFANPAFPDDEIELTARRVDWNENHGVAEYRLQFRRHGTDTVLARGKVIFAAALDPEEA